MALVKSKVHMCGRIGRRLLAVSIAGLTIAVSIALVSISDAQARSKRAYDLSLVPPPPPTPLLNIAPPPMVLPYSAAYENYQPGLRPTPVNQQRFTQMLLGTAAGSPFSSGLAPENMAQLVTPRPAASLNAFEAKARGFGKARQNTAGYTWPGGAAAAPHSNAQLLDPWLRSCVGWYSGHAASHKGSAGTQGAPAYFKPAWPNSLNEPGTAPVTTEYAAYGLSEPPHPAVRPSTSPSNVHTQGFHHRKRVIATR